MMTFIAVLAFGLVVTIAISVWLEKTDQFAALSKAEAKISSLQSRNIPTDHKSLTTLYDSRTSSRDTDAWLRIFDYLKSEQFKAQCDGIFLLSDALEPTTTTQHETQLSLRRNLIRNNADLLDEIHTLAAHATSVRFGDGHSLDFKCFDFRQVIRLLTCETSVLAADHDSRGTYRALQAQIDTIAIMRGRDLIVDHLVLSAVQLTIASNVADVLQQNVLSESDLSLLINALQTFPASVQTWKQIVQYERGWILPYLRGQEKFETTTLEDGDVGNTRNKDVLNYLNYMERLENVEWPSWKLAKQHIVSIEEDLEKNFNSASTPDRRNWRSTMIVVSAWSQFAEALAKAVSARNQAILACGLRLYQYKYHSFPDRLNQLIDIAIDPANYRSMTDLPFGFQFANNTAYLWGPIRNDDFEFPFEIAPTIPRLDEATSQRERENIEKALWILQP